jgi:serine/threonine-protein kinase RsbW
MRDANTLSDGMSLGFPATFGDIASALRTIMAAPMLCSLSLSLLRDLELVLAESLNNVAEHAYAGINDGSVSVCISRDDQTVRIEIQDTGQAMPKKIADVSDAPPMDEGGRGWLLIRSLCKSVHYRRDQGVNHLTLEFISSD